MRVKSLLQITLWQFGIGNLARHSWDTVGTQLKYSWGTKLKTLGHSSWVQLGHSRDTVGA